MRDFAGCNAGTRSTAGPVFGPVFADARHARSARPPMRVIRGVGLGLITGAADGIPSEIGTYAAAGAKFGPACV